MTLRALVSRMTQAAPPAPGGVYVHRRVLNRADLVAWAQAQGLAQPLDEDTHVTVVYSQTPSTTPPDPSVVVLGPDVWKAVGRLGPNHAVVLHLAAPLLQSRYAAWVAGGATSPYAAYQPHVTLYSLGADADPPPDVPPLGLPPFGLVLGPEVVSALDGDALAKAVQHFPAGTPGGKGGQFMPLHAFRGVLSGGASSIPALYNKSVKSLGQALQAHAGDAVATHAAIDAIHGPPAGHSFGKKFAALKAEAKALVDQHAQAEAAKPAAVPVPDLSGVHLPPNKAKWNANTLAKIQAATMAADPAAALAAISISPNHHKLVQQYHAAVSAQVGAASVHVKPKTDLYGPPVPPTPTPAPPPPIPPLPTQVGGISVSMIHPSFVKHLQGLHAMAVAGKVAELEGFVVHPDSPLGAYKKQLLDHLKTYPSGEPNAVMHPVKPAAGVPALPASYPSAMHQKLVQMQALAKAGHVEALASLEAPGATQTAYKAQLLQHAAAHGHSSPAMALVATPSPGPAAHVATTVKAVVAPHAPLVLPRAPALDTSFPADQQKLFTAKVKQLQEAATGENAKQALATIPTGSPALVQYKANLLKAVRDYEATKPLTVGDMVSYLKVASEQLAVGRKPTPFPTATHEEFAGRAYQIRAGLPMPQKGAVNDYQASGHDGWNWHLRNHGTVKGPFEPDIRHLDRVLASTHLTRDVFVIRRFSSPTLPDKAKNLVGRVLEDPAFMSTSLDGAFGKNRNIELRLNVPKGHQGLYLNLNGNSQLPYERELLLPRNTRFEVKHVRQVKSKTVIYANVIPHAGTKGGPEGNP